MRDANEQLKILGTINEIGSTFFNEMESDRLLERLVETSLRLIEAERGTIFIVPQDQVGKTTAKLESMIATGIDSAPISIKSGQGIAGYVFQSDTAVLSNDVMNDPRFFPEIDKATGYETNTLIAAIDLLKSNDPMSSLELMIKTLSLISESLEANITDSKNNLLSKQMIEHFRTYASRILQEKSYPVSKLNQV